MVTGLNPRLYDTALPCNLLDSDFSLEHFALARPHEECTLVQTEICYYRLVAILGEITVAAHAVIAPTRAEVGALATRLKNVRAQLPQKLKMMPLEESLIDSPSKIVDRVRIEFRYQKCLIVLYRRFMGSPEFEEERQQCINAAIAIVHLTISVLEASEPGAQLAQVRILLVRHLHDYILAASLLCVELRRLESCSTRPTRPTTLGALEEDAVRSTLLQACHMWKAGGIPYQRAQLALNTMVDFLERSQSHISVDTNDERSGFLLSENESFPMESLFTPAATARRPPAHDINSFHQEGQQGWCLREDQMFQNTLDLASIGNQNDHDTLSWLQFQGFIG